MYPQPKFTLGKRVNIVKGLHILKANRKVSWLVNVSFINSCQHFIALAEENILWVNWA